MVQPSSPALVLSISTRYDIPAWNYRRFAFDVNEKVPIINLLTVICERRWKYLYVTWFRRSFPSYHRLIGFSSLRTGRTKLVTSQEGDGWRLGPFDYSPVDATYPFSKSLHQPIAIYIKQTIHSCYKVEINWNRTGKTRQPAVVPVVSVFCYTCTT